MADYRNMSSDEILSRAVEKLQNAGHSSVGGGTSSGGSSGSGSYSRYENMSSGDILKAAVSKASGTGYQRYTDWVTRYRDTMQKVSAYTNQRNGGWTSDAFGGYRYAMDRLIGQYDDVASGLDQKDVYRFKSLYDSLKGTYDNLLEANKFYGKFKNQDEYDRRRSGYSEYGVGYTPESWNLTGEDARKLRQQQAQKDQEAVIKAKEEYDAAKAAFDQANRAYAMVTNNRYTGTYDEDKSKAAYDQWIAAKTRLQQADVAYNSIQNRLDDYNAGFGRTDKYSDVLLASKGTKGNYDGPSYDELNSWNAGRQKDMLDQQMAAFRDDTPPAERSTQENMPALDDKLGFWLSLTPEQREEDVFTAGSANHWENLTEGEISAYYYLLKNQGQSAAYTFLEDMTTELGRREDAKFVEKVENADGLTLAGYNALSVAENVLGALPSAVEKAGEMITGKDNPYSNVQGMQRRAQYIRGETGQRLDNAVSDSQWLQDQVGEQWAGRIGSLADKTYQAMMSGVDSAAGALLFGAGAGFGVGPFTMHIGGYSTVMGMGAFAQRAQELQAMGASRGQMAVGAVGAGILESIFEDISAEAFFTNILENPGAPFMKKLITQMGVEASEEVCTEIGNMVLDAINLGKKCDNQRRILEYVANGLSYNEAVGEATRDAAMDIFWAGFGGAVSAGGMAAVGQTVSGTRAKVDAARSNYYVGSKLFESGDASALVAQAQGLTNAKDRKKLTEQAKKAQKSQQEDYNDFFDRYNAGKTANRIAQSAAREGENAKRDAFRGVAAQYLKTQDGIQNKKRALDVLTKAYMEEKLLTTERSFYNRIGGQKLLDAVTGSVEEGALSEAERKLQLESTRKVADTIGAVIGNKSASELRKTLDSGTDGLTRRKDTRDPVNIRGISRVENGTLLLLTDDGEVDAKGLVYGTFDEAQLYGALAGMNIDTATAKRLLEAAPETDQAAYASGIKSAYLSGYVGAEYGEIHAKGLTAEQKKLAYDAGQNAAMDLYARRVAVVNSGKMRTAKGGLRIHESVDMENLNEAQKSVMPLIHALSDSGLPIELYASTEAERKAGKENGSFAPDGTIRMDINAGDNGQGAVAYALAHEITHFAERYSPEKFQALVELLRAETKKQGDSFAELVSARAMGMSMEEQYKGLSQDKLLDLSRSEVIAEMCETILSDTDAAARLSRKLQAQDKGLWNRIKDFFTGLVERLKKAYADMNPDSHIARSMKEAVTQNERILNAWVDAVSEGVVNFNLQDGQKNDAQEGMRYSLRQYTEQQKKNWASSKRIEIYSSQEQLSKFISDSVANKTMDKKMYFGAIPSDLAARIKADAGVDVENYNLSLGSYEVRKILKDHGVEAKEAPRGQRAIVQDDFAHIVDVVLNPQKIALSEDDYMGKPAVIFSGEHNGRMNVVAVVSDKRLDLFVQTIYANVKKGNLSTPTGEQAPINTPEANSGTVSNQTVPQSPAGVNGNILKSSRNHKKTVGELQVELMQLQSQKKNLLESDAAYRDALEQLRNANTFSERVSANKALRSAKENIDTSEIDQKIENLKKHISEINEEKYRRHREEQEKYSGTKTAGYSLEPDTRLKTLDNDYMEAVKRKDTAKMHDLVLQAAEASMPKSVVRDESGNLLRVYHYTNNDFTVFDRGMARTGNEMDGFFFAPDSESTREYGDRKIAAYLNITKIAFDPVLDREFDDSGTLLREKLAAQGYDGVARTENGKIYEYMVFDPEQVKSAEDVTYDDNGDVIPLSKRFDASKKDIRYSSRTNQDSALRRLEKQNEQLHEEMDYLRQLVKIQKSGNKDFILDRNSVKKQAGKLMASANAKGDRDVLSRMLNDFYRRMHTDSEITWDAMQEDAGAIADWLLEHHQAQRDSYAQSVLDFLKKRRVRLSDSQIGDIEYTYGSLSDFKRAIKGSIILDQSANTSLDQLWQEAAEQFPDRFSADTNESDMPDGIAEIVKWANSAESTAESEFQYHISEYRNDLMQQVLEGYWDVDPVKSVSDDMKAKISDLKQKHKEEMKKARAQKRQAVSDIRAESKAALAAYKAQRDAVDKANKALYEAERAQMVQAYNRDMKALESQFGEDTRIMQKEFFRLLREYDKQTAKGEKTGARDAQTIQELRDALKKQADSHKEDSAAWNREFNRLLREYDASGRQIDRLEAKVKHQQEAAKTKVESRKMTEARYKIERTAKELNRYLLHPTNTVHVPAAMQESVAKAMDALTMAISGRKGGINADRMSEYAYQLRELQKDPSGNAGKIADVQRKIQTLTERDARMQTAMADLKEQYQALQSSGDPAAAQIYDENVAAWIQDCLDVIGETEYRDMSLSQLESVQRVYRALLRRIQTANKAFREGKQATISEKVGRLTMEMDVKKKKAKTSGKAEKAVDQFFWNNLKPVYAFDRIGSSVMSELYENLRSGEDTWYNDVSAAKAFFLGTADKYGYNTWDNESLMEFESATGQKFQLNLEERMSLYSYSLREQARDHLKKGGIVLNENTERVAVGLLGVKRNMVYNDANAYNLTDETITAIGDSLTADQRAFAREMQQYLSTTMGAKGNEISRQLYDIDLFKEQFYWPLVSSKDYSARIKDAGENPAGNKIKNMGAAKPITPGASNPVVLSGFMDTWAGHVNQMSMYHAFTLPMEDFYRVYNWNSGSTENSQTKSTVQMLKDVYGDGATNYIDQFLKDLNGGLRADPRATVGRAMLSRFKKSAVFASASVAIQQPSAIGRAFSVIDPKYFVGSKVENAGESWEQCKRYAPIAGLKEMGRFDMDMGRSTIDYITAREYTGFREKASGFLTDSDYRDEIIGKAPELADQITWCAMWEAAKRQTAAKNPGLSGEALLQQAGKLFTECITRTQVYDSVFSRSANMRSKDTGMAMVTSFMAEPTTSINMIENAVRQWSRGYKMTAAKAVTSVLASVVINSALVSLVYAARNKDEDKTYWEKYMASLTGELMEGVNPITYIPYAQDVWNMLQGYDVERSDMSLAADAVKALNKIVKVASKYPADGGEEQQQAWLKALGDACWAGADGVASILGIPEKNIRRDIVAVMNLFKDSNWGESDSGTIKDAIVEAVKDATPIWNQVPDESRETKLYKAIIGGTPAQLHRLQGKYDTPKKLETATVAALRLKEPRIRQAAEAHAAGDDQTRLRIAKELIAEKHFTQNQVVAAINAEVSRINSEGKEASDKIREQSLYYTEDYIDAVTAGLGNTEAIKQEIIRAKVANSDKEQEEAIASAERSFMYAVKDTAKDQFLDGDLSMEQTEKILKSVGVYDGDEEDIHRNVYAWQISEELGGKYDWSATRFVTYWDTVRGYNISADMYDEYLSTVYAIRGIDYDGDGEPDAYSAIDQVLAYIDSLPISNEQKDLLFALKYPNAAKKTLKRRPWIKR